MKNLLLLFACLPLLLSAQKAHTSTLTGHLDAVGAGALTLRHAYDTTGK
ncbi:MAG: hypothetical protein JST76_07915, partial [Bacteroidetes bacterium]|nr:hypothetical protein [Bacteroidota bacterium]